MAEHSEEWDKRFASIMKETELSLAKVKRQLSSPVAARRRKTLGSHVVGSLSGRPHAVGSGRLQRADRQAGAGERRRTPAATRRLSSHYVSLGAGVSPPGRRWELEAEVASLQRHVQSLQSAVEDQNRQIFALKGYVSRLHKKLGDVEADRKYSTQLEEFKCQVSRELDLLRRWRRESTSLSQGHTPFTAVAQELHSRRAKSEDIDAVHRDLSHLKSRMVAQESETTALTNSLRDVERKQESTRRALSGVEEWRHGQGTSQLDSSHQHTVLRQSLSSLEHRLSSLERRLLDEISLANGGNRSSDCPLTLSALRVSSRGAREGAGRGPRNPLLSGHHTPGPGRVTDNTDDLDDLSDDEGDVSLSESYLLDDAISTTSLDTTL